MYWLRVLPLGIVVAIGLSGSAMADRSASITIKNPWIVNDRVADCRNITTMGNTFKNAYTAGGVVAPADDQAIAINCYNNHKRRYYHWADIPPDGPNGIVLDDPVYGLNVFGWGLCFNHGPQNATIVKAAGLDGHRIDLIDGNGQSQHTIYEAYYWGRWHLMDTMTTMYVYDRGTPRQIAGCDDIKADHTLMTQAAAEGRACPGFLLCGDDAYWFADAIDGYQVTPGGIITNHWSMDMDLHTGETFKRTWESWLNQHPTPYTYNSPPYHHEATRDWNDTVNLPYWEPYSLTSAQSTAIRVSMMPTYRRWANGTYDLSPDFRTQAYQAMVYGSNGMATYADDGLSPDLHPATVGIAGEMIFRIKPPFYHTDANISGAFVRTNAGDVTQILVSTDGTTWTSVWTGTQLGTTMLTNLNLRNQVFGTWGYYVKVVLLSAGGSKAGAGVSNLVISTTFDHNKGAMAYLDKGVNNITVTFDNPQELAATRAAMKVAYKWKEYVGSGWAVDKSYETYVSTSPTTFTLTVGGTKVPRTEYIQMEVVALPAGDINKDGRVDTADLLMLAGQWGRSQQQAGFDVRCDLNGDGSIDVVDLLTLAGNWVP
jgi:hypothetical protein